MSVALARQGVSDEEIDRMAHLQLEDRESVIKFLTSIDTIAQQVKSRRLGDFEVLIAGLCVESRLPVLTGRPQRYRSAKPLRVVPAGLVKAHDSAEEILQRVSWHRNSQSSEIARI